MTKHEADVIGGLNMTDQISNEAYKQIMIAAQDENEVGEVLDKIRVEIDGIEINGQTDEHTMFIRTGEQVKQMALDIIDKYTKGEDE